MSSCWQDNFGGMFALAIHDYYWNVLGDRKVVFYKDGYVCDCNICKKFHLFWGDFEEYQGCYIDIVQDMKINEEVLEVLIRFNQGYVEHIFKKDSSPDYQLKLFLGLYYDTAFLPETLGKNKKRLLDFCCAPYIFMEHKDYILGV